MNFFGITLRRPSYAQLTSAVILAVGLWLLLLGVLRASGQAIGPLDAASALAVIAWSCVAVPLGIRIGDGARHLAANLAGAAMLLVLVRAFG